MTTLALSLCLSCKHAKPNGSCSAFPGGIPDDIVLWGVDHRKPWPGDHGIQWELAAGKEDLKQAWDHLHKIKQEGTT